MSSIRILIADDHSLFREGLSALLLSVPDAEVVGEAVTGEEAIVRAADLQTDVVLMDIQMPGINGVEVTRSIVGDSPHTGVMSSPCSRTTTRSSPPCAPGARGYVLKGADQDEILKVIHAVAGGEAYFGPKITHRLMSFFSAPRPAVPAEAFPELTAREREVLDLIAAGKKNQEIARELYLSPQDRTQQHLQRLHQAAGSRPGPGHNLRPRGRDRRERSMKRQEPKPPASG